MERVQVSISRVVMFFLISSKLGKLVASGFSVA